VFTVSYFVANEPLLIVNPPVKKKEVSPKSINLDKDCIERQNKLKDAGYYKGKIDGDCGPGTIKAANNFDADKDKTDEIARLEKVGWKRNKPKFGNIKQAMFGRRRIKDQIPEILRSKLKKKIFNFQLSIEEEVVLYRSSISDELIIIEINEINKKIKKNEKIKEVSFATVKEALSYPLKVNEVTIGYYNYKEKEDTQDSNKNKAKESKNQEEEEDTKEENKEKGKNKENKSDQDQESPTDVEESPEEESQEELDKSNN
jgi:hypothetical protein